ncbi:glycoside hydrolase 43 family protein [Massilia sp. TS11]|uniref:glycoside hydrolase family 43 protein n=1 Tax=Massilia sp. TS11 TaxID=2908003 RepID=UPI001EDA95ED|nr:glycoside hydrolase 43 family protein [Massilia sp. TS11]MCG2583820.1 glycoside hydrolase 43 family protein [Massilia sp. TS11]
MPARAAGLRAVFLSLLLAAAPALAAPPWQADLGDGRYQNPVLHADYSDPDAIRVGDRYYMTASSFNSVPGLPLLVSRDLVNWELVGHALARLVPEAHFATPRYGDGVWAPCLRYHDGQFWIFYPDPDFGVYVITARDFSGPWSAPHLLLPGKGIIDPTPLWDADGKAYLLHGWAKSRAGFNNRLTLRAMAPDASRLLDDAGQTVIDGDQLPGYRTLEGPKFYQADGYYYVFAPAGGVEEGWQAVFRSRSVRGPYAVRTVMDQGRTPVNGPHQGAWVRAADGQDWFLHFQDKQAYGRVVHLQPMRWEDGWPLIGEPGPRAGTGQPVLSYRKPLAGAAPAMPPTSDDFSAPRLGPQWQWNANPQPGWASLSPGRLRLHTVPAPDSAEHLRSAPGILSQKLPAPAFVADTRIQWNQPQEGDRAGLILNAMQYAWLGLRQRAGHTELVYTTCTPAALRCKESNQVLLADAPTSLHLRVQMEDGARARFAYSLDGQQYTAAGPVFTPSKGRWVGAQLGLFSIGLQAGAAASSLDVAYFRLTQP